jgi:GT2 family glycosyltransferase
LTADIGYVIPTLGLKLDWLEQSLASIRTFDDDSKIVVVCNSITAELKVLTNRYSASLILERNKGVFAAINLGAEFLSERNVDYFGFLGDDDILMPNSGRNLRKAFKSQSVKAAYGQCWYVDKNNQVLMKNKGYPAAHRFLLFLPNLIPNPGALIEMKAWKQLGGYHEEFKWAGDLDFWIRLSKIGKIKFVDVPMSMFRWHTESLTAGQRTSSLEEAFFIKQKYTPYFLKQIGKILNYALTAAGELFRKRKMQNRGQGD